MPLHAETRRVLQLMEERGAPPLDSLPPDEARAARRALAPPVTEPCHETVAIDAGGVPARLYRPDPSAMATTPPGLLVFFHGGGWVIGDLESHDNVCHALCRRSGHVVLSVDYRLAPEHPFPAGLDDARRTTVWAHDHADELGIDPRRLAIGGDSAGANLAAVVGYEQPVPVRFQLLVYPVTDARMITDSYEENAEGYFLTASSMRWFVDHYLGGAEGSPTDPRVSPLLAPDDVLASSPPTMVITAGYDPLRDEGVSFAERLGTLGVATSHVHYPGQIHGFFSLGHLVSDARGAAALAAQALLDALAPDSPRVEARQPGTIARRTDARR